MSHIERVWHYSDDFHGGAVRARVEDKVSRILNARSLPLGKPRTPKR